MPEPLRGVDSLNGKEYGQAVRVPGPLVLSAEVEERAWSLLMRSFAITKDQRPEYGLTTCERRTGPVLPARELGQMCEECADARESANPPDEDPEDAFYLECPNCDGYGWVPGPVIPGLFEHSFGWYARVEDGV